METKKLTIEEVIKELSTKFGKATLLYNNKDLDHYEVLIFNNFKWPIAYVEFAIDEFEKVSIFGGQILSLPSDFVRVYNFLEGMKNE